jgi:hypothetical protein
MGRGGGAAGEYSSAEVDNGPSGSTSELSKRSETLRLGSPVSTLEEPLSTAKGKTPRLGMAK